MESLSSESKSLALDILLDIQSAIEKLRERTKEAAIKYFIAQLNEK